MMQVIAFMSVYQTEVPANVEIYVQEFRKAIKFEVIKPDNVLGLAHSWGWMDTKLTL